MRQLLHRTILPTGRACAGNVNPTGGGGTESNHSRESGTGRRQMRHQVMPFRITTSCWQRREAIIGPISRSS